MDGEAQGRVASGKTSLPDSVQQTLEQVSCPACGWVGSLILEDRLVSRPIGSFSLAGRQMKVTASRVPHLVCTVGGCEFVKAPDAVE